MNLLQVQDTLKNASDQQLMALMQAPDSTAPSYLVLSEIRRRKDMRAKQAPGPGSNRTVAEELTAPQEPAGIQALQGQPPQGSMDPDGADAAQGMAAGGLASLRRYQEGGVVRMQDGGQPPISRRPLSEMSQAELNMIGRHFNFGDFQGGRFSGARPLGRPQYSLEEFQAEVFRRQNLNRPNELRRFIEDPESAFANRSPDQVNTPPIATPGGPLGNAPSTAAAQPAELATAPAAIQPPAQDSDPYAGQLPTGGEDMLGAPPSRVQSAPAAAPGGASRLSAAAPTASAEPAGTTAPTPRQQPAAGIRSLAPAANVETQQEPNLADIMRRTGELFPDNMSGIRDRMREDRVDPAARRSEAVNMALIEAGLRIAGSRNPSLIGAIGESALPAVQGYGQQLNQIRGEQRQSRQDELELAKQEVTRQFAIGQISSAEYRSRMENINANARIAAQERGADRRAGASEAAADRRYAEQARRDERLAASRLASDTAGRHGRGEYTPQEFAALSPEQQTFVRERFPASARSDLAAQQEEARARAEIARTVSQSMTNIATRESTRAELVAARRRENPTDRNPVVTDNDVRNYLLEQAIQTHTAASAYGRQAQPRAGGAAPILTYDPDTRTIR